MFPWFDGVGAWKITVSSALAHFMLSDKKRSGGTVNLIIPREIGRCEIIPTPVEKLAAFVEAGL